SEASGTAYDWSGSNDGTPGSGVTRGVAGAIVGDSDTAVTFNGTDNGRMSTKTSMVGPNMFSQSMWIKTTTTSGGKILGFATAQTGT
ncbi:hypothetical protein NL529_30675, partial [Klebsiella pneumoniae]|nr:hypothetical protein [Klebsiella pneumoniae]